MAQLARVKLSESDIADRLGALDGWTVSENKLRKEFAFDAYLKGPEFASKVARIAEELDHHPDILIGWRRVVVSVNTHTLDGLSPYDFELAKRIDTLK